ncbi:MAG TPA: DUF2171 domain-containing protein [Gaiellaceae bacterium]|nr:DUF2171 domain-containing protein [Gaiellaceae bacterium]
MSEPVSWLMIKPGWKVYASDGTEVGEVDEVAGDDNQDIFNGLAIATTALGRPKYVPAERVTTITEGHIDLSLTRDQVEASEEFLEPPTSAEIEADSRGGFGEELGADVRELEAKAVAPVERRQHRMNVWRRIAFALRRLVVRR